MRILRRETVCRDGKLQVAEHTLLGPTGVEIRRLFIDHPGAVAMVPVLPDGRIAMIRSYRHTVDRELLELPAGTLQPGELPEPAALRELAEETGYHAGKITKILEFYPSPGPTSELMHLYLAEELTPGPQRLEADEQIELEVVELADALARTRDGRIVDAKTMIGLWHFAHLQSVAGRCKQP